MYMYSIYIHNYLYHISEKKNHSIYRKCESLTLPKISFDVYLPDAKFKKSHPGLPNHRISVLK